MKTPNVGLSLSVLRGGKQISQRQLAHEMGISQPAVNKFERDINDLRISSLKKYALSLGMKLSIYVEPIEKNEEQGRFYLIKEEGIMSHEEQFFKKIEEEKKRKYREEKENKKNQIEKKELELEKLNNFIDHAKILIADIKVKLKGKLEVTTATCIVDGGSCQSYLDSIIIKHNDITLTLRPTGPKYGVFLGNGVIELLSTAPYFKKRPFETISFILQLNNDTPHWIIYYRNQQSGEAHQEILNNETLFNLLNNVFFGE